MKAHQRLARVRGGRVKTTLKAIVVLMNVSTAILCAHIIYTIIN